LKDSINIYDFLKAERTSQEKFTVEFYGKTDINPITLQKNNRWAITRNNIAEGKLLKRHRETNEVIEMQKGYAVTVMNNVEPHYTPMNQQVNYQFYLEECLKIANQIKYLNKETHLTTQYVQQLMFT